MDKKNIESIILEEDRFEGMKVEVKNVQDSRSNLGGNLLQSLKSPSKYGAITKAS